MDFLTPTSNALFDEICGDILMENKLCFEIKSEIKSKMDLLKTQLPDTSSEAAKKNALVFYLNRYEEIQKLYSNLHRRIFLVSFLKQLALIASEGRRNGESSKIQILSNRSVSSLMNKYLFIKNHEKLNPGSTALFSRECDWLWNASVDMVLNHEYFLDSNDKVTKKLTVGCKVRSSVEKNCERFPKTYAIMTDEILTTLYDKSVELKTIENESGSKTKNIFCDGSENMHCIAQEPRKMHQTTLDNSILGAILGMLNSKFVLQEDAKCVFSSKTALPLEKTNDSFSVWQLKFKNEKYPLLPLIFKNSARFRLYPYTTDLFVNNFYLMGRKNDAKEIYLDEHVFKSFLENRPPKIEPFLSHSAKTADRPRATGAKDSHFSMPPPIVFHAGYYFINSKQNDGDDRSENSLEYYKFSVAPSVSSHSLQEKFHVGNVELLKRKKVFRSSAKDESTGLRVASRCRIYDDPQHMVRRVHLDSSQQLLGLAESVPVLEDIEISKNAVKTSAILCFMEPGNERDDFGRAYIWGFVDFSKLSELEKILYSVDVRINARLGLGSELPHVLKWGGKLHRSFMIENALSFREIGNYVFQLDLLSVSNTAGVDSVPLRDGCLVVSTYVKYLKKRDHLCNTFAKVFLTDEFLEYSKTVSNLLLPVEKVEQTLSAIKSFLDPFFETDEIPMEKKHENCTERSCAHASRLKICFRKNLMQSLERLIKVIVKDKLFFSFVTRNGPLFRRGFLE